MAVLVENNVTEAPEAGLSRAERCACFHCGDPCRGGVFTNGDKQFCCHGCLTVHDILISGGLGHFYDLSRHPGVRANGETAAGRWEFLDEPEVRRRLVDFTDEKITRVTLKIPAIHCIACVWLLENLFQLHP